MLLESQILSTLDNSNKISDYTHFISLGQPYSYLIDCRLNIFVGDKERWAIVTERLGYNPRAGTIELEISYFGNCLINLDSYNGQLSNYYYTYPLKQNILEETTDGFVLNSDSKYWVIKDTKVYLSQNIEDYLNNGIELNNYQVGKIGIEDAARLIVINHTDLFRASDKELYKSIPEDLKKILVLDEWYHKDFIEIDSPNISDEHLNYIYDFNRNLTGLNDIDIEAFSNMIRTQESNNQESNKSAWINNRPSSYETWQQLAKVIATRDLSFYKPTQPANTHWSNWPESGSL
ncbi:MAG TPA: hypothetical protein VIM89_01120 [Mucilaginibacter sp.]